MTDFPYPPNLPKGVADSLTPSLSDLRNAFSTDAPFLRLITDHFVNELERGLSLVTRIMFRMLTVHRPVGKGW